MSSSLEKLLESAAEPSLKAPDSAVNGAAGEPHPDVTRNTGREEPRAGGDGPRDRSEPVRINARPSRQVDAPFVLRDARGSPYLVPRAVRIVTAGKPPVYVPLDPHLSYTFGRSGDASVVLEFDSISRIHGRLSYREDGRWTYRDLGSSNGSYLSEFIDPDELESARRLEPGRDHIVAAAQTIVLSNAVVRLTLLPSIPGQQAQSSTAVSDAAQILERALADHAPHALSVFLLGPTGSGKTYLAKRIHDLSGRKGQFVLVNCGRLPKDAVALHSELLGHVKNAFTGAATPKQGRIHAAEGGTLFLDEVESLSKEAQQFLLDLLDGGSGDFAPFGADPSEPVAKPDFRLISASKVPLASSGLRADLCFRLARGGVIRIPSLEERKADIPTLINVVLREMKEQRQLDAVFDPDAIRALVDAPWPGHIRDLRSAVETLVEVGANRDRARRGEYQLTSVGKTLEDVVRASAAHGPRRVRITREQVVAELEAREQGLGLTAAQRLDADPLRTQPIDLAQAANAVRRASLSEVPPMPSSPGRKRTEDLTADDVRGALEANAWNKTHAARALGIAVNTLKAKMKLLGIGEPK